MLGMRLFRLFGALLLLSAACSLFESSDPNAVDDDPTWSPDGRTIAYIRYQSKNPGLYLIEIDGRNNRVLLDGKWICPAWSPDGQWLVFSTAYEGTIYKVKVNGDSLTQLTTRGRNFFPDWSVANKIVFDSDASNLRGGYCLWTMDPDGSNKRNISEQEAQGWRDASWSPDGSRMVFYRYYPGGGSASDLAIMDSSGQNQVRLTDDSYDERGPSWSPDGSAIAVSRAHYEPYRIWILDLESMNWTRLPPEDALSPTWSPDAEQICFRKCEPPDTGWQFHETGKLWIMDRDGRNARQLTK